MQGEAGAGKASQEEECPVLAAGADMFKAAVMVHIAALHSVQALPYALPRTQRTSQQAACEVVHTTKRTWDIRHAQSRDAGGVGAALPADEAFAPHSHCALPAAGGGMHEHTGVGLQLCIH